jgi:hypothetical protein
MFLANRLLGTFNYRLFKEADEVTNTVISTTLLVEYRSSYDTQDGGEDENSCPNYREASH